MLTSGCKIAHDAGQKYMVITSKHHDGFCMFDTKATDYSVVKATPWGKDPIKALAEACPRHGIKFCVYYSIMDWHSPNQTAAHPDPVSPEYNPTHFEPGQHDKYLAYMKAQLKELVTQYHPGLIWFDGGWLGGWTADDGKEIYNYLRHLDPKIIVNNREGGGYGDYDTPEQNIPAKGLGHAWETCMTINDHWGYASGDHNFKSSTVLLRNLIDITSKGGNYLLNVGPTDQGVISDGEVHALKQMGDWLKVNGAAIYGTTASPFNKLSWGRVTQKPGTLYLHVFDWPADGKLALPGLDNKIRTATLVATDAQLTATSDDSGVVITLPAQAPDPISSTIVVKYLGSLDVSESLQSQASDGSLTFAAGDVTIHGSKLDVQDTGGVQNLGYWVDPTAWVEWPFIVTVPGKYDVTASIACPGSTSFTVTVAGQTLTGAAPNTGDYGKFQTVDLGAVTLSTLGKATLTVKPIAAGWTPMNLASISLEPAP